MAEHSTWVGSAARARTAAVPALGVGVDSVVEALSGLLVAGALLVGCTAGPAAGSGTAVGPPQRIELTYAGGAVQGGVSRLPVGLGRPVRLVVNSDVADEVHVHGYDLKAQVPARGVATVDFVADRSGVFEVELESRSVQLAQLEVR